jgi:hypothetical protein
VAADDGLGEEGIMFLKKKDKERASKIMHTQPKFQHY